MEDFYIIDETCVFKLFLFENSLLHKVYITFLLFVVDFERDSIKGNLVMLLFGGVFIKN